MTEQMLHLFIRGCTNAFQLQMDSQYDETTLVLGFPQYCAEILSNINNINAGKRPARICVCTCVYTCLCVHVCTHIYRYMHICIYTVYIYTYIYMCIYCISSFTTVMSIPNTEREQDRPGRRWL